MEGRSRQGIFLVFHCRRAKGRRQRQIHSPDTAYLLGGRSGYSAGVVSKSGGGQTVGVSVLRAPGRTDALRKIDVYTARVHLWGSQ